MIKFNVGDRVEAFGIRGVVEKIISGDDAVYVVFSPGVIERFTGGGLLQAWHKEPTLKLIELPEKTKLYSDNAQLMAELVEQARLNGMGYEREARLMARIAELEKERLGKK